MVKDIDWYIESQPLHFKMPNHYKNIRQLIFQFKETTENEQTIVVQIKLYPQTDYYQRTRRRKFCG